MGVPGADLMLSAAAKREFPFEVECKSTKPQRQPIQAYMEQAKNHGNLEPLVVIKENRSKPVVVIDAEYFFSLWAQLNMNERHDDGT